MLPNRDVVAADRPLAQADALFLERFAKRKSEAVWQLDAGKILESAGKGLTVEELKTFLEAKNQGALPQTVIVFLDDMANKFSQLKDLGTARLIACKDAEVAQPPGPRSSAPQPLPTGRRPPDCLQGCGRTDDPPSASRNWATSCRPPDTGSQKRDIAQVFTNKHVLWQPRRAKAGSPRFSGVPRPSKRTPDPGGEEPRQRGLVKAAPACLGAWTVAGIGDRQPGPGSGQGDVEEPELLVELGGRLHRTGRGNPAIGGVDHV